MEINDDFDQVNQSIVEDGCILFEDIEEVIKDYWDTNPDFFYKTESITAALCSMIAKLMQVSGCGDEVANSLAYQMSNLIIKVISIETNDYE